MNLQPLAHGCLGLDSRKDALRRAVELMIVQFHRAWLAKVFQVQA